MDHLWGVIMYYAKVGCVDTFKNRQLQSPVHLTSAPSFSSLCWAGESKVADWRGDFSAAGRDTVVDVPELLLEVDWQEVQRKSVAFLLTWGAHMNTRHIHMTLFLQYRVKGFPLHVSAHLYLWLQFIFSFHWSPRRKLEQKSAVGLQAQTYWPSPFERKKKRPSCLESSCSYGTYMLPLRCRSEVLFIDGARRKHSIFGSLRDECNIHICHLSV